MDRVDGDREGSREDTTKGVGGGGMGEGEGKRLR